MARGRRALLRHRGRARVPHVLPLPRDAADLLRDPGPAGHADRRHPRRHPAHPGQRRPVEHVPAQPRRAHARDGLHRGARVDVRLVRARLADARQRRHPSPAGARCSTTPARRSSSRTRCCCPCRAARACTTATRSAWATTSGCPTATPSARPMQWTPDRNAGLLDRRPGQALPAARPVARAPLQPHQRRGAARAADVAAALGARHAHASAGSTPRSGAGDFEVLPCDNESVLAFCRHTADETILVVANLASTARAATVYAAGPRGLVGARRVRRGAVPAPSAPTGPRRSPWARATSTGWS